MARKRLSKKFITFNPIKGSDFYSEFFINGKVKQESAIESIYNIAHMKATSFGVEVVKETAPIRGTTDGLMKVFINTKNGRECNFQGLQECKRNIRRGTKAYKEHVGQSLLYAIQFKHSKFIIIPSVNYIDYIFLDENNINEDDLLRLLESNSPCEACKYVDINNIKIHTIDMPEQADITEMWKIIIKHCIEL